MEIGSQIKIIIISFCFDEGLDLMNENITEEVTESHHRGTRFVISFYRYNTLITKETLNLKLIYLQKINGLWEE